MLRVNDHLLVKGIRKNVTPNASTRAGTSPWPSEMTSISNWSRNLSQMIASMLGPPPKAVEWMTWRIRGVFTRSLR